MHIPIFSFAVFSAAGAASAAFVGAWSPYALLLLVVMLFAALGLLVALLVLGLLGRLRPRPKQEEDAPEYTTLFYQNAFLLQEEEATTDEEAKAGEPLPSYHTEENAPGAATADSAAKAGSHTVPHRRTGLLWLLLGLVAPAAGFFAFNYVDNPAGHTQSFTVGTALCLGLFLFQVFCIVQLVRAQRKL